MSDGDEATWHAVDAYLADRLLSPADDLEWVLEASYSAGLPPINVSPMQGKLLALLASSIGAARVLEVGTLGGYSTIWLAGALPESGAVLTLELNEQHAEVARSNLRRAGLAPRVEVRVGPALDSLQALAEEHRDPFDLVFIDADKVHNAEYFAWAVQLSRPGALIVVDNVIREGRGLDAGGKDPAVEGTRRLFDAVAAEPRVSATAIQTVGAKGYDGFLIAVVGSTPAT